jgi:hypothetical protein
MLGLIVVFRRFGRTSPTCRRPRIAGLGILVMGLIVGGAVFYRSVEGFGSVDSFDFAVVT